MSPPPRRLALAALLLVLAPACGNEPLPPHEAAARELWEIARDLDRREDDARARIAVAPDSAAAAVFLDALAQLGRSSSARVLAVVPMTEFGRTAVDLDVALEGGGTARWTIQFDDGIDGAPRVVWLAGPGVEWPRRGTRGAGLSSSEPPR